MLKVEILFLVILETILVNCVPLNQDRWRIAGGNPVGIGEKPFTASLSPDGKGHFCGGTIISELTILTAAHCIVSLRDFEFISVRVGTNLLNSGGDVYQSKKNIIHEGFNLGTGENDIALLILEKPIIFGPFVSSIPIETREIGGGEKTEACGWGALFIGGFLSDELQCINLVTITNEACKAIYPFEDRNSMSDGNICTLTKYGEGVCKGDSGGPLISDGKVVGIVSWGVPCARGYPDVYTRVSCYQNWIEVNKS